MKKQLSLLCICVLVCQTITACQFHQTDARTDEHAALVIVDYEGVYQGTLPCADCPGIAAKLTLNTDNSFVYETRYLEEKDGAFSSTGSYTVTEDLLTLHPNGAPIHFLMEGDSLHMLDADLKPATGVLAPYYTLKKQK
ncbi:MAG: copper homeostasis protein [Deltaproteobacteria bacterium]|nr:MAG: copper homeostasis protein [Deltaproteobacteria bacterium]